MEKINPKRILEAIERASRRNQAILDQAGWIYKNWCPNCTGEHKENIPEWLKSFWVHKVCPLYVWKHDECKLIRYRKWLRMMETLRIPARYRNAQWKHVEPQVKSAIFDKYLASESLLRRGVAPYIQGPVGTGKTSLLCLILIEVYRRYGVFGKFVHFSELFDTWTSINKWKHVFFLGVDDIGSFALTRNQVFALERFLVWRYDHEYPTIFTSNLLLEGDHRVPRKLLIENIIGKRCQDRIREMCFTVTLTGQSKRKSLKQKEEVHATQKETHV